MPQLAKPWPVKPFRSDRHSVNRSQGLPRPPPPEYSRACLKTAHEDNIETSLQWLSGLLSRHAEAQLSLHLSHWCSRTSMLVPSWQVLSSWASSKASPPTAFCQSSQRATWSGGQQWASAEQEWATNWMKHSETPFVQALFKHRLSKMVLGAVFTANEPMKGVWPIPAAELSAWRTRSSKVSSQAAKAKPAAQKHSAHTDFR